MSYDLPSDLILPGGQSEFAQKTNDRKSVLGKLPVIILLVFVAVITVDRLAVPQLPISVDAAFYAVVSHELLNGKLLYADLWDHKPPAIFVIYAAAELLLGYSQQTIILLNIFITIIVLIGLFYAGKAGPGGVVTGLWAAAMWVIVSGSFAMDARDPNTEPFLNACLILAFALLAHNRDGNLKRNTAIIIGLLFALGSLLKPTVVVIALFLIVAHVVFSPDRRKALKDALIIGSVGAASWVAVFCYFAATDRFDLFYRSIVVYNRYYAGTAGNILANMIAPPGGKFSLPLFFLPFMAPLVFCAFGGLILILRANRRHAALLVGYLGSCWIAIAVPGRFWIHYYQIWLPPLIVCSCWTIGYLYVSTNIRTRVVSYAMSFLLAGALLLLQVSPYASALKKDWVRLSYVPLSAGNQTADKINSFLKVDETFFIWGASPNLYLLAKRRPPAAVFYPWHYYNSPLAEQLTDRVKGDLARERPELLVADINERPIPDWIAQEYEPTPIYQDGYAYSFFARRGGRLANRSDASEGEK